MQKGEELTCCLCKKEFTTNSCPRMMSHGQHNGCTACLKQLMKEKISHVTCQHCGHQQVIEEWNLQCFPKNIVLNKLIKERSLCENQESSKDTHGSSRSLQKGKQMCEIHQKQLEIICLTDRERMCPHCALFGKHKDHQFKTVNEVKLLMSQRFDEFNQFRVKKQCLDARINSSEFRQSIKRKIGAQKDRMVLAIKEKFQEMNENVRLAEKKAYEDVAKSFKNLTQKITSLIKQQSDSHKKYQEWQQRCSQFFEAANKSNKIEEKVSYYFGGPLQLCSEGDALLKRIEFKVDSNVSTIEALIFKAKMVQNPGTMKSIFNYINVFADDGLQVDELEHVPQQVLSPRQLKPEGYKKTRIQFGPNPLEKVPVLRITPNKNGIAKQNMNAQHQKNDGSSKPQGGSVQKIIEDFSLRENLDTLDLSGLGLNDVEICQILKQLKPMKKIKGLKLIKNKLSSSGLSKIIEYIPSVTNLNLAFNLLGDEALMVLLDNQAKIPLLRVINVSNNKINERNARAALEQLKRKGLIVTI